MPICVHCNYPAETVYTVYQSAQNIRLGVCPSCKKFLDPLIEHPTTLLLLDLVLLKPRVYRHLAFNRGSEPSRVVAVKARPKTRQQDVDPNDEIKAAREEGTAGSGVSATEEEFNDGAGVDRSSLLWNTFAQLFATVVLLETAIQYRQTLLGRGDIGWAAPKTQLREFKLFIWLLLRCLAGNTAQHITTTLVSWVGLYAMGWVGPGCDRKASVGKGPEKDGRRADFRLPMIPLTLLYSSLLPLALHIILSIYSPLSASQTQTSYFLYLPPSLLTALARIPYLPEISDILRQSLQQENINEMWIATHLLSGMSSGLALRVLLPTRAGWTMGAVLGGWVSKAGVEGMIGG